MPFPIRFFVLVERSSRDAALCFLDRLANARERFEQVEIAAIRLPGVKNRLLVVDVRFQGRCLNAVDRESLE